VSNEKDTNKRPTSSDSNAPKGAPRHRQQRRGRNPRGRGGGRQGAKPKGGRQQNDAVAFNSDAMKRARERFEVKPLPMGIPTDMSPAPTSISMKWKTNPVPLKAEREASELIVRPGEFGFLEDDRVDEIAKDINHLDISLEQALSLRAALNQEKAVYSHGRLQRRARELSRRYDGGETVLALSKRFDFPPVNLFRAILSARNWSKTRIKETLRSPKKKLNDRDLAEFQAAEKADRVTHVNQAETHHAADIFEVLLCEHFEKSGVRFRTQDDLMTEQVAAEGRPVRTPDLLMLDDVEINGVPVAWIDAKHYYGANLSFPRKKTQKQVNRYVEEWGYGAIVFRHGFCDGLRLRGALLLDANELDLSKLITHNRKMNEKRNDD